MNQFEHPGGKELDFMVGKLPVNARVINGIDLKALKVRKVDAKNMLGPKYEV